jgi:hypothetical protein
MSDSSIQMNPGSGGDVMDATVLPNAAGTVTNLKRERVSVGDDGRPGVFLDVASVNELAGLLETNNQLLTQIRDFLFNAR